MDKLEKARSAIERFTAAAATSLRVEAAVFSKDSTLFFATPTYLRKKGSMVHAPAIQEVLNQGSVFVNKPGENLSCAGCRFKDNCPSTVEILCCIKVQGEVEGVVSITSFSKDGEVRITQHTQTYLDAVVELASLLGEVIYSCAQAHPQADLPRYISSVLEVIPEPALLVNANGLIVSYNSKASQALTFCTLYAASLRHLFAASVVERILRGNAIQNEEVLVGEVHYKLRSTPIMDDERLNSAIISLHEAQLDEPTQSELIKNVIGIGDEAKRVHFLIRKLANSPTPVLITGETGTGKELVARNIHQQSKRRKFPFVAVNCSSIPEALFESELFGYEEGSFTGAKKGGKKGKFELAQGGTLFLDELGDMPLSVQPKLLRVLQEYTVERVGSTNQIPLDIRILAATNSNLEKKIKAGTFREDLYYRIGVINLELPPLRRRKNDIMPIATDYLSRLKRRLDTPLQRFDAEVVDCLHRYNWSGNIRELQNVVEYMANLCEQETAHLCDLPPRLLTDQPESIPAAARADETLLRELLLLHGHTLEGKKRIAEELGISLRTLYRRLECLEKQ